jgi:hypothetical protein
MQFRQRLHQHTTDEQFLYNVLRTDEEYFAREGVFNVHDNHFSERDNSHAIWKRRYSVCFSVSIWAGLSGNAVTDPYLPPDGLTAQRYRDFLGTVLPGLPEGMPLAVRPRLWSQDEGAPALCGEEVCWWFNAKCLGKVEVRLHGLLGSQSNSDGFLLCGYVKDYVYAVPPRTMEDFVA